MNRKITKTLLIIFSVMLVAELAFIGVMKLKGNDGEADLLMNSAPTETSVPATEPPTEEATAAPTEETLPPETEPQQTQPTEQRFILTFAGDCTLGSTAAKAGASSSFIQVVGEDYDYPFANVAEYFKNDDFTIVNLEGPLTETGTAAQKTFAFKGPTAYTQILTGSSVEAVTLANNHAEDYGTEGYKNTAKALTDAGVYYVEKNNTTLLTTESGLKIGLYAASFDFSKSDITSDIAQLRKDGAEIVICAFHWGTEGSYRPTGTQESFGKAAIDAGADIVYGSHPHVLQKVEQYKDGIIYYSLGNFSFGGSTFPQDYDSAVLQQEVIRDADGKISLGELKMIPVSISSINAYNNYQPTPYEEGSDEYNRVISKLDGSFKGADLVVDYSSINGTTTETTAPTEGSTGETTAPTTGGETGGTTGDTTGGESGGTTGGTTGGESGGTTGGTTGGETGGTTGGTTGGESGGTTGGTTGGESGGTTGGSSGGDSTSGGSSDSGSTGGSSTGGDTTGGSSGGSGDSGSSGDSGGIGEG